MRVRPRPSHCKLRCEIEPSTRASDQASRLTHPGAEGTAWPNCAAGAALLSRLPSTPEHPCPFFGSRDDATAPALRPPFPLVFARSTMASLPLVIRPELSGDAAPIERLHERAFGPGRFARTAFRLREGAPHRLDLS